MKKRECDRVNKESENSELSGASKVKVTKKWKCDRRKESENSELSGASKVKRVRKVI
jgi:hypothetical protein